MQTRIQGDIGLQVFNGNPQHHVEGLRFLHPADAQEINIIEVVNQADADVGDFVCSLRETKRQTVTVVDEITGTSHGDEFVATELFTDRLCNSHDESLMWVCLCFDSS